MKVFIIGVGPGDKELLTLEAQSLIKKADMGITTPRLYETFKDLNLKIKGVKLKDFMSEIIGFRQTGVTNKELAVLVSGDSGFFSATKKLKEKLKEFPDIQISFVCGLNTMQYLCSRIQQSYEDIKAVSLHGRQGSLVPFVSYNPWVFALTGGELKAHNLLKELVEAGLGRLKVVVGEKLSAPDEKIITGTASTLSQEIFGDLVSILVHNDNCANRYEYIRDTDFLRSDVPMTKEAVRKLAISFLNICPDDIIFDIGAGTGSVAIEIARKAYNSFVYAVERNQGALDLLKKNREAFQVFNLKIIGAEAPCGLKDLPAPDKVFIGGSGRKLEEIFNTIQAKNPRAEIVLTAVTLETLEEAKKILEKHKYCLDICCLNASWSRKLGSYHMMKAENPVYIIKGYKNEN